MTKLLEQALAKARALPETEQDAIAQIVLDEIDSEQRWDTLFAKSPGSWRSWQTMPGRNTRTAEVNLSLAGSQVSRLN